MGQKIVGYGLRRMMIDIKIIRDDPEKFKTAIKAKGREVDIDKIIDLDLRSRSLITKIDALRHEQKLFDKDRIEEAKKNKQELKSVEQEFDKLNLELENLLLQVPNPAADFVPQGGEEKNQIIRKVSEPTQFDFKPLDHTKLGEKLNLLDFERAAKVAGSRFVAIKNAAAVLEWSLFRYIIDKLISKGFDFILPPHLINGKSMRGMGYLEHGGDQETYYLDKDDLYLIGTSEHVLGSMHANEVFQEKDLPYRVCAYSPCYRREAGSYGKDTKGMLRVHQFNKIEMFSFTTPEQSQKELEYLLSVEEEIVKELGLPYQVVLIASGDLGDPAAAKYDIEAWMPGQNKYREITSCSTTTDFQARRLNIRYKNKAGANEYLHTLNGTASSERPLIALLENYQKKDGTIAIPEVLVPYFGKKEITNANNN